MAKTLQQKLEEQWRAQNDLQTLRAAAQIQQDRARLTAAKIEGKKEQATLKKIVGGSSKPSARRGK